MANGLILILSLIHIFQETIRHKKSGFLASTPCTYIMPRLKSPAFVYFVNPVSIGTVSYTHLTPREKVIDQLVEDLKWAAERMPEERYTGDKLGRLDRWGALAILARIALQNERWELAAKTSEYIIENSHATMPSTMNIPLTAPHTSRIRPIPPPKPDASIAAVLSSSPVISE